MKDKSKLYQMTCCAVMAAVLCVIGPLSIPIGPIPVSLTNMMIFLTVYLLGAKGATISVVIYLLLGAFGMPVFSGYQGGLGKVAGPTGGFLISYIFLALIGGIVMKLCHEKAWITGLGMFGAQILGYLMGTLWFVFVAQAGFWYALTVCVFPFVIWDALKIVVATILGKTVRKALQKAKLIPAGEAA